MAVGRVGGGVSGGVSGGASDGRVGAAAGSRRAVVLDVRKAARAASESKKRRQDVASSTWILQGVVGLVVERLHPRAACVDANCRFDGKSVVPPSGALGAYTAVTFEAEKGRCVAGKYELLGLLGRGAMGEVWLARHQTLGEEVALKILKIDMDAPLETSSWRARFQFEAQVAARLSRKTRNIVQVTDHGEHEGASYLVMERLVGESLGAKAGWPLPLSLVQSIVTQVAHGLAPAHREGIIHRDLKADNVFLTQDEDGNLLVKILDFGIARPSRKGRRSSASSTGFGTVLGTPSYMSPEQSQGLASLDHRADLWALAVLGYEALTGAPPFVGDTIEETIVSICLGRRLPISAGRPDLGSDVERFFERAFADKVQDRFQSAEELADAFSGLVGVEKASVREPLRLLPTLASPTQLSSARSRRRRFGTTIAVATTGACIGLALLAARPRRTDARPSSTVVLAASAASPASASVDAAVETLLFVEPPPRPPPPPPPKAIALAPLANQSAPPAPRRGTTDASTSAPPSPPVAPTSRVNPSNVF